MSSYIIALPFEEVGSGQYSKQKKNRSAKSANGKKSGQKHFNSAVDMILPTDFVDQFCLVPAYTSDSDVEMGEGAVVELRKAQQKWIDGGIAILIVLAILCLVLLSSNNRFPKAAALMGVLMAASSAGIFAWERQVRRGQDR